MGKGACPNITFQKVRERCFHRCLVGNEGGAGRVGQEGNMAHEPPRLERVWVPSKRTSVLFPNKVIIKAVGGVKTPTLQRLARLLASQSLLFLKNYFGHLLGQVQAQPSDHQADLNWKRRQWSSVAQLNGWVSQDWLLIPPWGHHLSRIASANVASPFSCRERVCVGGIRVIGVVKKWWNY